MAPPYRVDGLRDFQKELRLVDRQFPRELRKANLQAAEVIAEGTRREASADRVAAKAAAGVRAAAQQRNASVVFSKTKRYEFIFGAFFGAKRFPQFRPWVGNQYTGGGLPYHLAETVERDERQFLDVYEQAIDDLMRKAFPN